MALCQFVGSLQAVAQLVAPESSNEITAPAGLRAEIESLPPRHTRLGKMFA